MAVTFWESRMKSDWANELPIWRSPAAQRIGKEKERELKGAASIERTGLPIWRCSVMGFPFLNYFYVSHVTSAMLWQCRDCVWIKKLIFLARHSTDTHGAVLELFRCRTCVGHRHATHFRMSMLNPMKLQFLVTLFDWMTTFGFFSFFYLLELKIVVILERSRDVHLVYVLCIWCIPFLSIKLIIFP